MKTPKTHYMISFWKGQIGLAQYVKAWKTVKANPEVEFKEGINAWWPQLGKDIYKDFIDALHDRINIRGDLKINTYL